MPRTSDIEAERLRLPEVPCVRLTPGHAQRTLKRYNRMMIGIGMPRIHRRTGLIHLLRDVCKVVDGNNATL